MNERERFEAWVITQGLPDAGEAAWAWAAWQAATAQAVPPDVSTVETAAWMICEPGCKYGPTFGTENAAWIALTKAPPGSELVELVQRKA